MDPIIILASGSPRRAAVLRQLGILFVARPTDVDERWESGEDAAAVAERLARAKAAAGAEPGAVAFGFDTLVVHRGDILGKPASAAEAVAMVQRLSGDAHDVWTGIAAAAPGHMESAVERTRVRFRRLEPGEAEAYVATGEPLDKAGAYGIQGAGASLVRGIEGDFFNVMGFPMQRFLGLLARMGLRYAFDGVRRAGDAP